MIYANEKVAFYQGKVDIQVIAQRNVAELLKVGHFHSFKMVQNYFSHVFASFFFGDLNVRLGRRHYFFSLCLVLIVLYYTSVAGVHIVFVFVFVFVFAFVFVFVCKFFLVSLSSYT